jgi:hypothetical protein
MGAPFDRQLFELIFSDAHVIDVDFSQWDQHVDLCVVADHTQVRTPPRLPLFLVEFWRVSKFALTLNHLEVQLDRPEQHFQWNIDDFRVDKAGQRLAISLFGGKTWPGLQIECADIRIRQLPNSILDNLFPGWNRPHSGLARPSIEATHKLFGFHSS